jgi:hypothetical protein
MMSYVQKIRASVDQSLDRWEAAAQSVEDNIGASGAAMTDRVEQQKTIAGETAERLRQAVARSQQLPADAKQKITSDIDHLKVQLALGKADARDAVEEQKSKIAQAVRSVEANIDAVDRQIDRVTDEAIENWIRAEIALVQEYELAAMKWEHGKAELHDELEAKKQEIRDKVRQFRANLEAKRSQATDKGEVFAAEMSQAFDRIKNAFGNLVS